MRNRTLRCATGLCDAQQDSAMRNRTIAEGDRWAKELGGGFAPDAADS